MREFIAVIEFDEDVAAEFDETKGYKDRSPGDVLEQEFGWLYESGIVLCNWALVDYDIPWEQYIKYLTEWAIEHSSDDATDAVPMTYDQWKKADAV